MYIWETNKQACGNSGKTLLITFTYMRNCSLHSMCTFMVFNNNEAKSPHEIT